MPEPLKARYGVLALHTLYARLIVGLLILAYAAIRLAGYFGHASKTGLARPGWWRRQRPVPGGDDGSQKPA
ncbi:MAG TPA: hypothetical protein VGS20_03685 [Candidatus Acidoferrales bacterium]|nr:hypothetical protein [Candidatus Acidoferrales bacterium]